MRLRPQYHRWPWASVAALARKGKSVVSAPKPRNGRKSTTFGTTINKYGDASTGDLGVDGSAPRQSSSLSHGHRSERLCFGGRCVGDAVSIADRLADRTRVVKGERRRTDRRRRTSPRPTTNRSRMKFSSVVPSTSIKSAVCLVIRTRRVAERSALDTSPSRLVVRGLDCPPLRNCGSAKLAAKPNVSPARRRKV
jgi:hypothetical protein